MSTLAVRDAGQLVQHRLVEGRDAEVERQVEVAAPALEVLVELAAHVVERRAQDAGAEDARDHLVLALDRVRDAAEAARGGGEEQVADGRGRRRRSGRRRALRASAAARKRASSSGVTLKVPPQSADAGRRGGAGCLLGGAEGGADLGVGKVVAVAEHDGGALGRRQLAGVGLELLERGGAGSPFALRLGRRRRG